MAVASLVCFVVLMAVCIVGIMAAPSLPKEDMEHEMAEDWENRGHCAFMVTKLKDGEEGVESIECGEDANCVPLKSKWWVNNEERWFNSGCAHKANPDSSSSVSLEHHDPEPVDQHAGNGDLHCAMKVYEAERLGVKIQEVHCGEGAGCRQVHSRLRISGVGEEIFPSGCVHEK